MHGIRNRFSLSASLRTGSVLACALPLLGLFGMSASVQAQKDQTATLRAKEPKVIASVEGATVKPKLVTWGYLRMYQPATVLSFLSQAKNGKVSDSALIGLAEPQFLTFMKSNVPMTPFNGNDAPTLNTAGKGVPHVKAVLKLATIPSFTSITPKSPIKVDAGKYDCGNVAQGQSATFTYTGMIPTTCQAKVYCISASWKIKKVELLSGEIDPTSHKQIVEKTIDSPASASSISVKAGQDLRLTVYVPVAASKTAGGDDETAWLIDSPMASYSGAVTAHYYENSLIVIPLDPVLELIPGDTAYVKFTVINPTPKSHTVSISSLSAPTGVSITGANFTLPPSGGSKTVSLKVTVSGSAPAVNNRWTSFKVSTPGINLTTGVMSNVMQPFYSWEWSGSCGKIDFNSTLAVGASGLWHWSGHLHDNSTFYGDDYDYVFFFQQPTSNGGHYGHEMRGSLGASLSGPPVDKDYDYSGTSADIRNNFPGYATSGYHWTIQVAGDIGQLLGPIENWIKQHAGTILDILTGTP